MHLPATLFFLSALPCPSSHSPFIPPPPHSLTHLSSFSSSDTQSQGSGGDSKSDSPTPEGSRKNGETAAAAGGGGVAGVSVRCGKGHELSVPAGKSLGSEGVCR